MNKNNIILYNSWRNDGGSDELQRFLKSVFECKDGDNTWSTSEKMSNTQQQDSFNCGFFLAFIVNVY